LEDYDMGQADAVAPGDRIDYTPSSAVAIGDVLVLGGRCYVADRAIAANVAGSLAATGVFNCTKNSGAGINVGTKLYWDDTNNYVATTDGSGTHKGFGFAAETAASAAVKILATLSPF
jgi:predicted RecA/RadA family phage recombinase